MKWLLVLLAACSHPQAPASPSAWARDIAPLFERDCTPCHLPGGEADVDLSSEPAWQARRRVIEDRVLHRRDMPPMGSEISEADRDRIARWLAEAPAQAAIIR